jgi:hypothetical protein
MKSTTRGTIAAVVTGVAAAMGAAATPASAAETVPVPVPLEGVENSLRMEVPRISAELPVLTPGAPDGPRYVEGRLLPDRALPQLPVSGGLPGVNVHAPLPHVLGDRFDHVEVGTQAADMDALAPGLVVDAPLTSPDAENFGLPDTKLPEVGVLAPVLRTVPTANLGMGPGL